MKNRSHRALPDREGHFISRRQFLIRSLLGVTGFVAAEMVSPLLKSKAASSELVDPVRSLASLTRNPAPASAYLARPTGRGPFLGVLVIQDWWGVDESVKRTADRLAAAGFLAIVPDLFAGRAADSADEARQILAALNPEQVLTVLHDAVSFLTHQGAVDSSKIGIVSSDFGSRYAIALSQQSRQIGAIFVLNGLHVDPGQNATVARFLDAAAPDFESDHLIAYPIENGQARPFGGIKVRDWAPMLVLNALSKTTAPGQQSIAAAEAWQRGVTWLGKTL